ncbi:MAG: DUF2975 domain-containing protein [Pseudomonadota bacterium]
MTIGYRLPKAWQKACRVFQLLCAFVALFAIWAYFTMGVVDVTVDAYWQELSPEVQSAVSYSPLKKGLLWTISTIAYFAPVLIVYATFSVFSKLASGEVFIPPVTRRIRFLGLTIILYALSRILMNTLMILALTYDNPPSMKVLSFMVNGQQITMLMVGVIILLIGQVFTKAVSMAEEHKQFV